MSELGCYAGTILFIDLSTGKISEIPTMEYSRLFIGGRGIGCKIYWDKTPQHGDAFDPENHMIFVTGPLCGISGFAGSRWQVCGKSPLTQRFSYANLGGSWGVHLKFAGYDALVIHGRAEKPVYISIDNDMVEIKKAEHVMGKGARDTREILKKELGSAFRIVTIGPAGENRVSFAILLADNDATGGSGFGAVMGSKNVKAIAVHGINRVSAALPEKLTDLKRSLTAFRKGLTFRDPTIFTLNRVKKDVCQGCGIGCIRNVFISETGVTGKFMCQSARFYQHWALRYYGKKTEVPFKAARLCDNFGVDTYVLETMIMWLNKCHKTNLLTERQTCLPLSSIGSFEFIEKLVKDVSFRSGFGHLLANGTHNTAEELGGAAKSVIDDYITKTGNYTVYDPRMYITTALLYATEPRLPIQQLHEIGILCIRWAARALGYRNNSITSEVVRSIAKRFWGSELAADFSTYDGKPLAAVKIQNRQYVKESLILCDFAWPMMHTEVTEDHVGDPSLESKMYSAVTGIEIDEEGLYQVGERIFNLQRAILIREGHKGREDDTIEEFYFTMPLKKSSLGNKRCLLPGKDGEPISRRNMVVNKEQFEMMKDEYYSIRGWEPQNGFPRIKKLRELKL